MLRQPLSRALSLPLLSSTSRAAPVAVRRYAEQAAPEKVEVFIDDTPVFVTPGTTILQVSNNYLVVHTIHNIKKIFKYIFITKLYL